MSWLYRKFVRPILFERESEAIHEQTLEVLRAVSQHQVLCEAMETFLGGAELPLTVLGLRFPNPLGLAAGMDKYARAVPAWETLGFGFCELGGVTWHPQPGNPKPRLYRIINDGALINRMGFNNPGAIELAARLSDWKAQGRWPRHPVGINLGKSKITPLSEAADDYARSFRVLWPLADFFVVNVSSPNTPNLRQLQDKTALDEILDALHHTNLDLANAAALRKDRVPGRAPHSLLKPILVKVAPDLSFDALDEIVGLIGSRQLAGIVATNTTIARPLASEKGVGANPLYNQEGGLSGKPLRGRSTEVIRHLYRQTQGRLPIIGVGGIFNAEDAWEKITAGSTLIQVYTGLIYEGPTLAKSIVSGLAEQLQRHGLKTIQEAVGIETANHSIRGNRAALQ